MVNLNYCIMKKIIVIITLLYICSSCQITNQKKAQNLIINNLKKTLNDYKSYESIEFSQLDSIFSTLESDTLYIKNEWLLSNLNQIKEYAEQKIKYQSKINSSYISKGGGWAEEMRIIITSIYYETYMYDKIKDSLRKNFKSELIGYKISHKFREKNIYGAMILTDKTFFTNLDITEIVNNPLDAKYDFDLYVETANIFSILEKDRTFSDFIPK